MYKSAPPMHPGDTLLLVLGGGPDLHPMIRLATARAFPASTVVFAEGVQQARDQLASGPVGLLVLVGMDPCEEGGLLGIEGPGAGKSPCVRLRPARPEDGAAVIPPEEWNVPLLSRAFRSAITEHQLLRDYARAQGDLLTLARRINHDLRTPLGGIMTAVEQLQEVLARPAGYMP